MKKNKSGFTLVELMITLAIFSIVMVGIIAMMSSTSHTYLRGSSDTNLQTEAQIAMNQIADIVIDADSAVKCWTAGEYYVIENTNESGAKVFDHLRVNQVEHKLYFAQTGSNAQIETGVMQVMADYVDSISFVNKVGSDNEVTLRLNMNNAGIEYTGEKEITYRNDVESHDMSVIDPTPYILSGGGGGSNNTLTVNRYEKKNLMTLYGITDCSSEGYGFVQSDGTCKATDVNYVVSTNSNGSLELSCTNTLNTSFASSKSVTLKGKSGSGDVIVEVSTPSVTYEGGTGIHFFQYAGTVNSDNKSYFKINGINVSNACDNGNAPTYELVCYVDANNDHMYESGEEFGNKISGTLCSSSVTTGSHTTSAGFQQISNTPKMNMRVYGDCLSGYLVFSNNNDSACSDGTYTTAKYRLACKLTWPSGGSKTCDIALHAAGDDVSNSYDASGNAWKVY